jgi:hypothetical protein
MGFFLGVVVLLFDLGITSLHFMCYAKGDSNSLKREKNKNIGVSSIVFALLSIIENKIVLIFLIKIIFYIRVFLFILATTIFLT